MSLKEMVWRSLRRGQWLTLWEIRAVVQMRFKRLASDASISARIRELRSEGKRIERQPKPKSASHLYRIGRTA
jgi:hypothetical protein